MSTDPKGSIDQSFNYDLYTALPGLDSDFARSNRGGVLLAYVSHRRSCRPFDVNRARVRHLLADALIAYYFASFCRQRVRSKLLRAIENHLAVINGRATIRRDFFFHSFIPAYFEFSSSCDTRGVYNYSVPRNNRFFSVVRNNFCSMVFRDN